VRAFDIELAEEGVDVRLLLQAVEAWRANGFLPEGEMHALVAAVLDLWLKIENYSMCHIRHLTQQAAHVSPGHR
jgi:hypothetical protein